MKTNTLRFLAFIFSTALLFTACSSDDDDKKLDQTPTVIQADSDWHVDSLELNTEKWYKVTGSNEFNSMKIEWSEFGYMGSNKNYTADIQVSAYKLDGTTPFGLSGELLSLSTNNLPGLSNCS